jgi:multiple sugar transport system permease protein
MLHLFNNAFRFLEMGYASALAWIFTVAVLILTIIQFSLSRRWVYYAGGE